VCLGAAIGVGTGVALYDNGVVGPGEANLAGFAKDAAIAFIPLVGSQVAKALIPQIRIALDAPGLRGIRNRSVEAATGLLAEQAGQHVTDPVGSPLK
jgi:hypothetical protein